MSAKVFVTPRRGVLDPQGSAVTGALHALGFGEVGAVHVGKYFEIELNTTDREAAAARVHEMCRTLLVNGVIEDYRLEIDGAAS